MNDNQKQWEQAAEKITPPKQGPLDEGDVEQPIHTEADKTKPITE